MDLKATFNLAMLRDVVKLRMGRTVAGTIRGHIDDHRVAQMLDHFTQYVGSSPYESPAVLCSIAHMQTDGGVWYPIGGTRAVPEALARLAESWASRCVPRLESSASSLTTASVIGVVTDDGETAPLLRRGLQHGLGADLSRAGRRRGRRALRPATPIQAGLLGRGAVPRSGPGLRPPAAPQLRLLARSGGGVRLDLQPGRARAGPDLLRRGAGPYRGRLSHRRAARRCTSWCTRPICVPTTTGARCSRTTGG